MKTTNTSLRQAPKEVTQMTKKQTQVSAPAVAAAIQLSPLGTPEGYTPKEVSLMLKQAGFPTDGKKIRRLLRAGKMAGIQFSGRWYISVKSFEAFVAKLQAQPTAAN